MSKERLIAMTDAVLAIVMTILVLDLPQPVSATWTGLWELRESYLAYVISFLGITIMWISHDKLFQLATKVDSRVLWANILMLFSASLFPYTTKFVEENFYSFVAEFVYGIVFMLLSLGYFAVYYALINADPDNQPLRSAVESRNKIIIDSTIKVIGFVVGFWYPPVILLSTIVAMLAWSLPRRQTSA